MFTERKRIKAHYFEIYKDKLFILEDDCSPLYVYDIHTFHLIAKLGDNYGGGLYAINDLVVDEHLKGVNVDTLSKVPSFYNCSNTYYYITNSKYIIIRKFITDFSLELHIVRLDNYQIVRKIKDTSGTIRLFTESNDLICSTEDFLFLYKDFSLLWQKEMRDFFNNEEDSENNQLQIQEIYAYKDTFIVVTTFGTVCLKQVDGSLIWKTDSYARTMEIVGNIGYVCTSLSLYKINLDTGEESGYGWIHDRLPDFEYGDRSYWPAGHRVVYHNGFLWYLVYDAGDSFIIAINPETGDYEWIHKVDTYEKADEIQFYEDKMFVLDTGGYLHIYEKEE